MGLWPKLRQSNPSAVFSIFSWLGKSPLSLLVQTLTVSVWNLLSFTHSVASNSLWPHGLQHIRLPCPSPSPRAYSNSCPLSQRCHPIISSSVIPFSSYLQSFPEPGSFLMNWLFASGGQSIGASASVLLMNIQDLFSLALAGLISWQSKGLSRVFPNTTAQKHQFLSIQPSFFLVSFEWSYLDE